MNLFTPVALPPHLPRLDHRQQLLLMGSCFAQHVGERLRDGGLRCEVNPYGVLYNPLSLSTALREMMTGKTYTEADLYAHGGLWHSPMHHGDFSSAEAGETLRRINSRLAGARQALEGLDVLLLTWGSAWVYEDVQTGRVVGNCHKRPESCFRRRRLSVEEIVADQAVLLQRLLAQRPALQVVLTVSPVRHLRDGLHGNQLSKSTLLLAAEALQAAWPGQVHYFPAYEIVVDELRDYRFYADDMTHPSPLAVDYVWERFVEAFFAPATRQVADDCAALHRMLAHRPLHPEGEEYRRFLGQILLKLDQLTEKYPYLDLDLEREQCRIRLSKSAR